MHIYTSLKTCLNTNEQLDMWYNKMTGTYSCFIHFQAFIQKLFLKDF